MNDITEQRRKQLYALIDVLVEIANDETVDRPTIRSIAIKLGKGKTTVDGWIKQLQVACTAYLKLPNR